MAKGPTFDTITAGYLSAAKLNANFASIVTSFENTISRDGSTPNTMSADFDMNTNDILNVGTITAVNLVVDGTNLNAKVAEAATSATAAATSATAAATSETNAAASFDSFDDRYLGAKASNPTLDNDGNALLTGAMYFNTTSDEMRVYDGAAWASLGGVTTFLGLSDTPGDYTGDGLKVARVNAGESAIEFVTLAGSEPSDGDKGDITVSGGGVTWNLDAGVVAAAELASNAITTVKITDDNVTYAKIQNVVADDVFLGRISGAGGVIEEITKLQATVLINPFTDALKGLVPSSGGGTTKFLRADQSWVAPTSTDAFSSQLLHVRDEQASGASGGTFNSGAWRTRTLNTVLTNEISGASLGSNQITLPTGTYFMAASVSCYKVDGHKCKLYNISDSADVLIGSNEHSSGNDNGATRSFVYGRFTLASQKILELQHKGQTNKATDGFGRPLSFSVVEVYSDIRIWKVG